MAYLNDKLAEYKDIVAKLTHEILAEDGVYRKKYNAKRRELNRVKKKLGEKNIYVDGVGTEEEAEEKAVASSLMVLANEATEFLAREIEGEAAEGTTMEADAEEQAVAEAIVDAADAAEAVAAAEAADVEEDAAAAEAFAEAAPGAIPPSAPCAIPPAEDAAPPAREAAFPILHGNPFSPLAELGTGDDAIEVHDESSGLHQSQHGPDHPLEPDFGMEDDDFLRRGSSRTPASRQDRPKRALTSPFDGSTPPKRAPSTSLPPLPQPPSERAPSTSLPPLPQPPSTRDAFAQVRPEVDSIKLQTEEHRVPQRNKQCQTKKALIAQKPKSSKLPARDAIPRKWINRKAKQLIEFISDQIIGDSSWTEEDSTGVQHVSKVISKLFTRHPVVLAGVIQNIGDKHTAFKEMKAEVESGVCDQIQAHLDSIAGPLYSLLNLTEREYQKLINGLSWEFDYEHGKHRRIRFKWGSKMPRFMSYITLREAKKQFM